MTRCPRPCVLVVLAVGLLAGLPWVTGWGQETKAPAKPQPTVPDEPLAERLSLTRAAEYLDGVNHDWLATKNCGTCHTTYPFLMARPALKDTPHATEKKVRDFFEDRAANWDTKKPRWPTEVVATASILAYHDAHTTGKLHPVTRKALDRMWTLQRPNGTWDWLKCAWPPSEHDDYYGVLIAALGAGIAPERYAESDAAQDGLKRVRQYLKSTPAPTLHHQAILLWVSSYINDLLTPEQRAATVEELLARQRPDGGWSLPSLGDWKWKHGRPNDPLMAESDGYATGLVLFILSQTGRKSEEPAIKKGLHWLTQNQRVSGRWFTQSYNDNKQHYITNAGTAYAVMALRAYGK